MASIENQRNAERLPFGRYKGSPAAFIADSEPTYALWLMSQPWFRDNHGGLYSIIRRRVAARLAAEVADEQRAAKRAARHPADWLKVVPAHEFVGAKL